ncbi:hypothetical protein ES705_40016 [subsurface metagenome]
MPSNHILINNTTECFVPDSKMEDLMQYLQHIAYDWQETHVDRLLASDTINEVTPSIPIEA